MDPITLALLGGGLAKAGAGIASGIGTARAAKKQFLTPAEEQELAELEARKRAGTLGLTEGDRGRLEQQFLAEQAGAQRELEATALQQAAARGLQSGVSGRELFLQEQAQASAERGMRQQQNLALLEVDRSQREAELARIDAMRAQQKGAEAQRAAGIAQAVSLGLAGAGDVALQAASMRQQAKLNELEAAARAETDQSLLNRLLAYPGGVTGGGIVPPVTRPPTVRYENI
ncbi:hypothetical protein EBT25_17335 [bacterium]|jgi:hypothetical protein|nr:hypothetical protein [bacterium]